MCIRNSLVSLVLVFVLFVNARTVLATTNCVEVFKFLGLSLGPDSRPVFWISRDTTGECMNSELLQIVIERSGSTVISTYLEEYGDWTALREGIRHLETEPPVKVEKNNNGTWMIGESVGQIRVPAKNPDFDELFDQHQNEDFGDGSSWNKKYGVDGISLPLIDGLNTELVVYYPGGLYVNYDISQAFYFQKSGYLLVFTHQPRLAIGLDSMHGFLILRATQEKDGRVARFNGSRPSPQPPR